MGEYTLVYTLGYTRVWENNRGFIPWFIPGFGRITGNIPWLIPGFGRITGIYRFIPGFGRIREV